MSARAALLQPALLGLALFWAGVALRAAPLPPFLHDPDAVSDDLLARAAAPALTARILTVVDKPQASSTGDAHDYVSYGRYWWPDPKKPDGRPFIRRDGHPNREQIARGDRARLDAFIQQVGALAVAWHRWQRPEHAVRAGDWLRAWLLTPATRMKPALDYAQIRLGRDGNRGSAAGVLEGRGLVDLVDALRLLHESPAFAPGEEAAVGAWFADYFQWLQTAPVARAEHAAANNHGTWFLVQAVAIARYLGRDDEARSLAQEGSTLIDRQFRPDGSQPLELEREDALGYSQFNLQAHLQLARLARPLGVELWQHTAPSGGSLASGLAYLRPYNQAPDQWPHRQNEKLKPGFLTPLLQEAEALAKR